MADDDNNIKKRSRSTNCSKLHSCSPHSSYHRNRYQHHGYHNSSHHSTHHNHHSHRSNIPPPQSFHHREYANDNSYRGFTNNHDSYHQPPSSRRLLEFNQRGNSMYSHSSSQNENTYRHSLPVTFVLFKIRDLYIQLTFIFIFLAKG